MFPETPGAVGLVLKGIVNGGQVVAQVSVQFVLSGASPLNVYSVIPSESVKMLPCPNLMTTAAPAVGTVTGVTLGPGVFVGVEVGAAVCTTTVYVTGVVEVTVPVTEGDPVGTAASGVPVPAAGGTTLGATVAARVGVVAIVAVAGARVSAAVGAEVGMGVAVGGLPHAPSVAAISRASGRTSERRSLNLSISITCSKWPF